MEKPSLPLLTTLATVLFCAFPASTQADLFWESEQVTKGIPGQPDRTRIVKNYISSNASRTDMGDQVMIMDYGNMIMYSLNPGKKTYSKIDMRKIGLPPGAGMDAQQAAQAQEMIKKMFGDIKVVPTNETKSIAGYTCKRYNVDFMMVKTEYWTSQDVEGYEELKAVSKKMRTAFAENPVFKNTNIMGMMDSLDGFPVQIINHMMGGTSTTTLKKVEQKDLPKTLFQVPEDYRLVQAPRPAPGPPSMPPGPAPR